MVIHMLGKKGILFGVGVGPGDPEMLTLKAVRTIRENEIIAVPGAAKEETVAYQIVKPVIDDLDCKTVLEIPIVMTKDRAQLDAQYDAAAMRIQSCLDQGKNVVFLTLGDPTVYATYMYVHQRVQAAGYPTEIISGIPSFCAVAARLNMSLVERSEMLHVIPSSYQIADSLKLPGTKVLMKAASKMKEVKAQLLEMNSQVVMIENCGMENEKIYRSAEEIDENAGYYSLIIVKENA